MRTRTRDALRDVASWLPTRGQRKRQGRDEQRDDAVPSHLARVAGSQGASSYGKLRQVLVAVLGDEHEILDAQPVGVRAVETGLDGENVAGDERGVAEDAEDRLLVHLEPDAVAERVEEALLERLALGLGALRREPCRLDLVADRVVDGPAR